MTQAAATLEDIWPFKEISVPGGIGAFDIERFCNPGETEAALWRIAEVDFGAPLSTYAIRLRFQGDRVDVAIWNNTNASWSKPKMYRNEKGGAFCSARTVVIEFKTILTGGIGTAAELKARVGVLARSERRLLGLLRFSSRLFAILAIVVLFLAIRHGVENEAPEVFAAIFLLAVSTGGLSVLMRETGTAVANSFLQRMEQQAAAEQRMRGGEQVSRQLVRQTIRAVDGAQQDQAAIFGFLLLCLLVYFISPLVVLGVLIGMVAAVLLLLGDGGSDEMIYARSRSIQRLENALLSWRATLDRWSPIKLRRAKILVLRSALNRYRTVETEFRSRQTRASVRTSCAKGVAFVGVLGAFAFSIVTDDSVRVGSIGDTLAATSLFSVAPVVVLISASKATAAVAQILVRNFRNARASWSNSSF